MQKSPGIVIGVLLAVHVLFLNTSGSSGAEPATETLAFMEIGNVFAAAKHMQEIKEAPASITVISEDDIRSYGFRNLADVLNNVKGFYTYTDRNYTYIGARGFARLGDYGSRVLQLVDGHTYNENIYGSIFLDEILGIDMDLIKQIEIIRGPGSTLFGSNALFGVINIITKNGKDVDGFFTKAEAGSHDTYRGGLIYGKTLKNDLDFLFSFSITDSDGQDLFFRDFDGPLTSNGWARDADGEKARKFFLKASCEEFSFFSNISWREKHVPTASYSTVFNDNRYKTTDERGFAEIKWTHPLTGNSEIMARAYYDFSDYEGDYPFVYLPVTINRDKASGRWVGTELKYFQKALHSHSLNSGAEVIRHIRADQKNYDMEPKESYLDDERSFTAWSAFIQDEWDVSPRLRLIGGVRYDHYSTFGHHFSPRAGVIAFPTRESALKLLYGRAFRAPTVYELYYNDGNVTAKGNPSLDPEILDTYELIWEQEWNPIVKSSISCFHYKIRDLITETEDPEDGLLQFRNMELIKSSGVEIGLEAEWPGLLRGHISYAYQDTVDKKTDRQLVNSPRNLVKSGVILPVYKNMFYLGVQCRYMGERLTRNYEKTDHTIIGDINLSARNIVKGLDLSIGVFNIFNKDYSSPVSAAHIQETIEQDGRTFWFKASYRF
ncbi:MAG: TonB-dependent receptor [Deltaproteobacteria bacterium]|nr:TonB-dependent receptor [Deltaproteobacteria bacterium]